MKWVLTSKEIYGSEEWEDVVDSIEIEADWVFDDNDLMALPYDDYCVIVSNNLNELAIRDIVDVVLDEYELEEDVD